MKLAVEQSGINWQIVGYVDDKRHSCNAISLILENNGIMDESQFRKLMKRNWCVCSNLAGPFWIYTFPTEETAQAALEELEPLMLAATMNGKGLNPI